MSAMTQPVDACLRLADALESSQEQCDMDGTMIAVSRQAVCEAIAMLRTPALQAAMQGCPEGWVLVPVGISDAMMTAGFELVGKQYAAEELDNNVETVCRIWRAMLAAAPTPPTAAEPGEA